MNIIAKENRATFTEKPRFRRLRSHVAEGQAALKLVKLTADISSSLSAPPEKKKGESKKLKKRLLEVSDKNETLSKTITDRNLEIAELKRSVQSLNEVLNSVPINELRCNSSIAGNKIIELSKKNRVLRAELETTKNRVSKKEVEIHKMEREMKAVQDKDRLDTDGARKASTTAEMQSKLSNMQQKLFETRNKNTELQTQLKLSQKCLQQEIGESFNLNALASNGTQCTWRGRAQQIINLQQRVHELKERLEIAEGRVPGRLPGGYAPQEDINESPYAVGPASASQSGSPRKAGHSGPSRAASMYGGSTIDRFTPGVRKSELIHRAKVDTLESEKNDLKLQLEEQRGKILALKVRNKTLNDEVLKHKVKACSLAEQTDYNGMNAASMSEKLSAQKYQFEQRIDEICREMAMVVRKRELAENREEEMRNKLENMEEMITTKDEFIQELHEAIRRLETDLKAVCGGFLFSCRELRKEEFIAILDSLEAEKNMLLEHNKSLNQRMEQERNKNESLGEQLSKQKMRICRTEAKIRDLEKELDVQTERKKRTQRIAEYANSVSSTSLSSFVFENSSFGKLAPKKDDDPPQPKIDDMKNQLEISMEKINLLEERIANLKMEKEQDAKVFSETIAKTKTTILETIVGQRRVGGGVYAVNSDAYVDGSSTATDV